MEPERLPPARFHPHKTPLSEPGHPEEGAPAPPDKEWSRSDCPQQGSIHIKLPFQNQAIRIAGVGLELDAVSAAEECARHGAHQGDKRSRVRPEARQEEAEQHQPTQTGPALWQKITHNWFNSVRRGIIIYTPNRRPRRAKVGLVSAP